MGLLIGVGNTKPTFPYDYFYGIEWDSTVASSACTRIGRPELHISLPIQSRMRRCILRDNGTVAYYLHANDSNIRDTGAAACLDGTDGQVMVEIPAHYRKFEVNGTKYRCLLSEHALPGFHLVPLAYRSAYEASLDRRNPNVPKLASVVNVSEEFRGGGGNADYDGTYRSFLGRPATNTSLSSFRTFARLRGEAGKNGKGWNCDVYELQKACYWLYAVEYANFNCQLDYKAQPTSEGYKQGGLGLGVTKLKISEWGTYNEYYPFVPCGYTNSLGNNTGVKDYSMPALDGSVFATVSVPSYRGMENPYGHIWKLADGCKCRIQSTTVGGLCDFFVCTDPAHFQDIDYTHYEKRGTLPRGEGYIKMMMIGEYGENMPKVLGASSSTYFSDYYYTNIPESGIPESGEDQRIVRFGGSAADGGASGMTYSHTYYPASNAASNVGTRLTFLPE